MGLDIVSELLKGMDGHSLKSDLRKQQWEIIQKDTSGILTSFGMINNVNHRDVILKAFISEAQDEHFN